MEEKKLRWRWYSFAVSGLLLVGFGLSLLGEAIQQRAAQAPLSTWFAWGTLALVVFNTGLSLFGQAVIYRWQLLQGMDSSKRN
jgi:hypothetical protein